MKTTKQKRNGNKKKPETSKIDAHVRMLEEAKLLETVRHRGVGEFAPLNVPPVAYVRLTWAGHDFLADARDEKVWEEAKKKAGEASFAIVKQVLAELAKRMAGL